MEKKYKTFGPRVLAGIIDSLVFLPFMVVDNILDESAKAAVILIWPFFYSTSWYLYSVILHGKYGQTLGKMAVKVKVYDIEENEAIGYKRAFYRDSPGIIIEFIFLIYFFVSSLLIGKNQWINPDIFSKVSMFVGLGWFLIELITMFTNNKRRALHDYLAKSVVINMRA